MCSVLFSAALLSAALLSAALLRAALQSCGSEILQPETIRKPPTLLTYAHCLTREANI